MNRVIKILGYEFYLKEFVILLFTYLMMENIFSWLLLPVSVILLPLEKVTTIIIFGIVLFYANSFKTNEKIYVALFSFMFLKLLLESFFKYGTLFEQLTLYSVLFPVIYVIYIKAFCRTWDLDLLEFIAKFHLVAYVLTMVIYGRGFNFGLVAVDMKDYGPFSGDSRIIHARSIFMIIIPLLWYLTRFLQTLKLKHLGIFIFCVIVILIHQHRSVWASSIVAMLVYFVLSVRNKMISLPRMLNILVVTSIVIIIAGVVLNSVAPQFVNLLSDRFADILAPNREGSTGQFRTAQREIYFQLFLKRPIFGWTFEGFEMPNPLVDWWPSTSGPHFHEGYMEMLFYHGIAGFLLKYSFLFYISFKAFSKKLSKESIVLIAFSISGFIFSFSYVLPLMFWGHVGLCLYYLERKIDEPITEHEEVNTTQLKEYPLTDHLVGNINLQR